MGDRAGTDAALYLSNYLEEDEYPRWMLKVKSLPGKKKRKKIWLVIYAFYIFSCLISPSLFMCLCVCYCMFKVNYCTVIGLFKKPGEIEELEIIR